MRRDPIRTPQATLGGSSDEPAEAAANRRAARPIKRSFSIAGHRTSISLEAAFWDALKTIAAADQRPLAQIVAEIDRERGEAGLSSAVRVYVLKRAQSAHGAVWSR